MDIHFWGRHGYPSLSSITVNPLPPAAAAPHKQPSLARHGICSSVRCVNSSWAQSTTLSDGLDARVLFRGCACGGHYAGPLWDSAHH
eukprot:6203709-Pleurochrysis_carterae.AAC.2